MNNLSNPPLPPVISYTVPSCNPYTVQLTATPNNPGIYNWSNGSTGNPIDAFIGGPYKLFYTDLYTCTVTADINTSKDPQGYLWIFPTGCYTACPPFSIPGPIIPFAAWDYHEVLGPVLLNGTNSIPSPFMPITSGNYGMALDNGYCQAQIETLQLTIGSISLG